MLSMAMENVQCVDYAHNISKSNWMKLVILHCHVELPVDPAPTLTKQSVYIYIHMDMCVYAQIACRCGRAPGPVLHDGCAASYESANLGKHPSNPCHRILNSQPEKHLKAIAQ